MPMYKLHRRDEAIILKVVEKRLFDIVEDLFPGQGKYLEDSCKNKGMKNVCEREIIVSRFVHEKRG